MWQGHWCKWTCVMLWYGKGVGESVEEKWGRGRLICGSVKSLLQIADDPSKYSDWFLLWPVWLVKLLSIVPSLPPPPASLLPTSNENESLSQWHLAWALCVLCALCPVPKWTSAFCGGAVKHLLWRRRHHHQPASQPDCSGDGWIIQAYNWITNGRSECECETGRREMVNGLPHSSFYGKLQIANCENVCLADFLIKLN